MIRQPIAIAVAPNGARKTKRDHGALPLSSAELIATALDCLEAGASMMHFHVRDSGGSHTLDHRLYRSMLTELEAAVGVNMLLQVSSEAAGRYQAAEQIELMKRLAPHCVSCGLREIISAEHDYQAGNAFFSELHRVGALVQYILYSPADVRWYETLCGEGVLPGRNHLLLFVLGRYTEKGGERDELPSYLAELQGDNPWMVCGFGRDEHQLMVQAASLGGHCRVGFENNQQLVDGSQAPDNAALVRITSATAALAGRVPGDRLFAESLHSSGR